MDVYNFCNGLRNTAIADPADPIDDPAKWLHHRQEAEDQ
jgi:hypothetical protein